MNPAKRLEIFTRFRTVAAGDSYTVANLSPAEKDLYDKAVASGNTDAAGGISQIALIRMGGTRLVVQTERLMIR